MESDLPTDPAERPLYLDHNATTPVDPAVLEAMLPFLAAGFGNPSSSHPYGTRAARAVEAAREQVAAVIGARPDEIVFTSGGTEANNLAIRGSLTEPGHRRRIVTSRVEHPATTAPLAHLEGRGWTITRLDVTHDGTLDPGALPAAFDTDVALGTVMLAQNETGALLPVPAVADAARRVGALVHTDAAQALGKVRVDVGGLGVDLLSIAGHKAYAPKGVGALYVRRGTVLRPLLRGASQEHGLRPGTENVPGIVALGAACQLAAERLHTEPARLRSLRELLWTLLARGVPALVRNTPAASLPNTLLVSFPGLLGREVLAAAPGVAASTGSACRSGIDSPSTTLLAMGVDPAVALGAVRLSLGHSSTDADITAAADELVRAAASCSQATAE